MDSSSEDKGHVNALLNPDLSKFPMIPLRLLARKTILLHNGSGVCIAKGLVRNLCSSTIVGSSSPLSKSQVFVQVLHTFVEEEVANEWRYSFKSWPI